MRLSDFYTLRALVREIAHQIVPLLNRAKRLHTTLEARGITSMDLLRSRVTIPTDEQGKPLGELRSDGKVYDAQNNVIADFSAEKYECDALIAALAGLRGIGAVLVNDTAFIQRGIVGHEVDRLHRAVHG